MSRTASVQVGTDPTNNADISPGVRVSWRPSPTKRVTGIVRSVHGPYLHVDEDGCGRWATILTASATPAATAKPNKRRWEPNFPDDALRAVPSARQDERDTRYTYWLRFDIICADEIVGNAAVPEPYGAEQAVARYLADRASNATRNAALKSARRKAERAEVAERLRHERRMNALRATLAAEEDEIRKAAEAENTATLDRLCPARAWR